MNKPIPVLTTTRLILRPLRLADASQIQRVFPHWEILKYMSATIPWPYPEDGAYTYLTTTLPKIAAGQEYGWAITLKSEGNDHLIGIISLYPDREENRGFWLAEEYQRNGLMTEAVAAVTDFAFDELRMPSLKLKNAEPNTASHRLKEKAGAKIVAIDDDVDYVGGKFRQIRWLLTRQKWANNRPKFIGA